jgi:hypothetical protein
LTQNPGESFPVSGKVTTLRLDAYAAAPGPSSGEAYVWLDGTGDAYRLGWSEHFLKYFEDLKSALLGSRTVTIIVHTTDALAEIDSVNV